jgi:hypothetical protein
MATTSIGSATDAGALGEQRELEHWRGAQRGEPPHVAEAKARSWLAASVLDAAIAAIITALLGLFFLGLTTDGASGPLGVNTRWGTLAVAVAVVAGVRIVLNLLSLQESQPVTFGAGRSPRTQRCCHQSGKGARGRTCRCCAGPALPF